MTEQKIEICRISWLNGPNIWTYRPCIETLIDIHELEQAPSNRIPGLYDTLTAWLPNLVEHRCGIGERGGFLERLRDGTYAAHILEHVVIELHGLIGQPVGFGKARMTSRTGIYKMVFRTTDRHVGEACLQTGLRLLQSAIDQTPFDLDSEIKHLKSIVDDYAFGPSTQHILDAAYARRIPTLRLNEGNLVQLGYGSKQQRIWTAETSKTSAIAESIASDKPLSKELIALCGVPTPQGEKAATGELAWHIAQEIGLPVVVKPTDANHGRGVSLELYAEQDVKAAWAIASQEGSEVMVEKFIHGTEHRILVINGEVAAAARGELIEVTGDGHSDLVTLVNTQINTDPRRGVEEEYPLCPIDIHANQTVNLEIQRQGYTPNSIPEPGVKVLIERNSNATFDVTDIIHPEIARLCALAARVVGLDIAGIDLVCEYIDRPPSGQSIAVIEVNAGPGLLMHIKPSNGEGRNIGERIIRGLFPDSENGRIPIVTYTGNQELANFGPALACLLTEHSVYTALACEQGLWMGTRQIHANNATDWQSGRRVLVSKRVNTAILQLKAARILADGLPFDRAQISIVTSIDKSDDLSFWDIQTPEQLLSVMRTAVDLVLPTGVAILNADEPSLLPLKELCDGEVIWLSEIPSNPVVLGHLKAGGKAVVLDQNQITVLQSDQHPLMHIDIPLNAVSEAPIHWLALIAAAWALQVPEQLIQSSLHMLTRTESQPVSKQN